MVDRSSQRSANGQVGFGALLRGLREQALVSQEQLAERAGLSPRTIRSLEQGRVRSPRGESVRLLANALGLVGQERKRFEAAARQLTAPVPTPAQAPSPTAVRSVPCLLPADIADFTGRAEQVEVLGELLSAPGGDGVAPTMVVSAVAGKAGVGKTALAVHVAHRIRDQFPDGQLYVNLRGAEQRPLDQALVLARLLRALGMDGTEIPQDQDDREALYRVRLADLRVLVVLDNAATEAQVRPLLPGTPGCAVLVTSRARLVGLEGARLLNLDVLAEEQAVELLSRIVGVERAAAEPDAAAAITRSCGYLPLAVRIAGARLAARPQWPLAQLADLLADERWRLDQLAAGDLEVRASLALSYQALSSDQQRALRLLSMLEVEDFSAWVAGPLLGIDQDRAEALVEELADVQVLDLAVVDATGASRYRFHDLVRLYAREQLAAGEPERARQLALERVTGGWLALAEQADQRLPIASDVVTYGSAAHWRFPRDLVDRWLADPLAWFELERLNLIAAVEAAAAAGLDEPAWELAGCLTSFFMLRGYWTSWDWVQETALTACRQAGNRRGEAAALTAFSFSHGEPSYTRMMDRQDRLLRALAVFRDLGDQRGEAKALYHLADLARWTRYYQAPTPALLEAVDYAQQARQLASTLDDDGTESSALNLLGACYRDLGRRAEASAALEQARRLMQRLQVQRDEAVALWNLAMVARDSGRASEAGRLLEQSLQITRKLGDRRGQAQVLLDLGKLRAAEGRLEEADALLAESLGCWADSDGQAYRAEILHGLGELRCRQRRYSLAIEHFTEAAALWQELAAPAAQARSLEALADVLAAAGRPQHARAVRRQAHTVLRPDEPDPAGVSRAAAPGP